MIKLFYLLPFIIYLINCWLIIKIYDLINYHLFDMNKLFIFLRENRKKYEKLPIYFYEEDRSYLRNNRLLKFLGDNNKQNIINTISVMLPVFNITSFFYIKNLIILNLLTMFYTLLEIFIFYYLIKKYKEIKNLE